MFLVCVNYTLAFSGMESVFALFSQHTYGWGAPQNGYVFTYVGVIMVVVQGGLIGRMVKQWGERRLLIGGLVLLAGGLALLAVSTTLAILLVALALLSIGNGAVSPTSSTLLSLASPPAARGATLGLAQGIAGLGRAVGPLLATSIFATAGAGVPFLLGAGLAGVAMVLGLSSALGAKQMQTAPELTEAQQS